MSYNYKTLIVFDTNTLRNTEAGEVAYSSFSFGKPYDVIDEFVKANKLETDVTLAVSTMVITELKVQKQLSYKKDIQQLYNIVKRLTGLPHITEGSILVPDINFDCAAFIEQQAQKYIKENNINTLEYKDEHAPAMLKNMLEKVVGQENGKSPFSRSGKFNDAGFKDSVIWETLMHYEKVIEYDKVIFLSKDGDYKSNCIEDFQNKWQRHIAIEKDENNVLAQLQKDYGNYISEREIYLFTEGEYFQSYLKSELAAKSYIVVESKQYAIENFKIMNYCRNVMRMVLNDDGFENIVASSTITIFCKINGTKKEIQVEATTALYDDESKEIIITEYDTELK
jgi:hypothetical protein